MDKHEFSTDGGKSWREVSEHSSIQFYMPGSIIFRIKPRTIKVNWFDVPAPMCEAPKDGDTVFVASITTDDLHMEISWFTARKTMNWLSRGICHSTKESAIAHAKAMIGIDPNGVDE